LFKFHLISHISYPTSHISYFSRTRLIYFINFVKKTYGRASKNAKNWWIAAIAAGIVSVVLTLIIFGITGITALQNGNFEELQNLPQE